MFIIINILLILCFSFDIQANGTSNHPPLHELQTINNKSNGISDHPNHKELQAVNNKTKNNHEDKIIWNLHNADIKNVVQQIAAFTGKNFILGNNISGTISLISETPIDKHKLYDIFLSTLEVIGLVAVPDGDVIKILNSTNPAASGFNFPLLNQTHTNSKEQFAIAIIELINIPAISVAPMLQPLMANSPNSQLIAVTGTNYLIAVDTVAALTRLKKIIKRIDVKQSNIDIMPLRHASASEVVNVLNQLINAATTNAYSTNKVAVAADDRSNAILLSGDKGQRMRYRVIIANLDQETEGQGNLETIYLRYQKAEDVMKVLQNVAQSYYNQTSGQKNLNTNSSLQNVDASAMQGSNNSTSNTTADNTSEDYSDLITLSNSLVNQPRQVQGVVINNTSITSEPSLNALIISSPPKLLKILKRIINEIDVRRRQVLVEAIIADVDFTFAQTIGVKWLAKPGDGRIGFSGINKGGENDDNIFTVQSNPFSQLAIAAGGFAAGVFTKNFDGIINLLQKNDKSNIIATPNIVTLDNVKAQIFSGQEVSVITNVVTTPSAQNNDSDNTFNQSAQFEYKAVGTTLALIPQITMSNAIQMQLVIGNKELVNPSSVSSGSSQLQSGAPTINNQSIKTSVLINNQDVLVLGGLKKKKNILTNARVPFFSNLPILGSLFKYNEKNYEDRVLMIFLRPIILDNQNKSLTITHNKYNVLKNRLLLNQTPGYDTNKKIIQIPNFQKKSQLVLPDPFLFNQFKKDSTLIQSKFSNM